MKRVKGIAFKRLGGKDKTGEDVLLGQPVVFLQDFLHCDALPQQPNNKLNAQTCAFDDRFSGQHFWVDFDAVEQVGSWHGSLNFSLENFYKSSGYIGKPIGWLEPPILDRLRQLDGRTSEEDE